MNGIKLDPDTLTREQWARVARFYYLVPAVIKKHFRGYMRQCGFAEPDPWEAGYAGLIAAAAAWAPGGRKAFLSTAWSYIWNRLMALASGREKKAAREARYRDYYRGRADGRPPIDPDLALDLAEAVASLTPAERRVWDAYVTAGCTCEGGMPDRAKCHRWGWTGDVGIGAGRMRQLMQVIKAKLRAKLAAYQEG